MAKPLQEISDTLRIRLVRKVAQGGMSEVYEGSLQGCEGFAKKVAVKMLLSEWTGDACFMKLFIAEAKLVSDLVHENIVQTYQLGRLPEGTYYIVMEFVEGLPLREFMTHHEETRERIPEPLAVHMVSRIARGLAYAHTFRDPYGRCLEIVHRDVCPNNVLITTEGLAKLTDFGIAKALSHQIIGDNWLTGKTPYMSPEQAACRSVDFRSDIYALGAVLFEMLSGQCIRPEKSDPQKQSFAEIPIPWNLLPPQTGPEIVAILRRMLAPVPEDRYQSTVEVARALEYYIYKDGYGPTIQTVETYLREHFPQLYRHRLAPKRARVAILPPKPAVGQETIVDCSTDYSAGAQPLPR